MEKIKGFATAEGTRAYRDRLVAKGLHKAHFRDAGDLLFSSIGMGSYLGDSDDSTDRLYEEAFREAVLSGVNVLDAAINYRSQRSERSFGRAFHEMVKKGEVRREEVVFCTKGGFLPFDGNYPADPYGYFQETYINPGIVGETDIVQNCHAMTPQYLEDQLERSLKNLGIETIDIYYIHNPEFQLEEVDRAVFMARMRAVFEWLEKKVEEGKIRYYGTATWNGYRVPAEAREHLSLEELGLLAREVAGPDHHFRFIQLPFNLAMPEAWVLANQRFGAGVSSLVSIAASVGVSVIASASLLQAKLAGKFPEELKAKFGGLEMPAQCSLQFVRSVPGITTALVGMKTKDHVSENLKTAETAPLTEQELILMFQGNA